MSPPHLVRWLALLAVAFAPACHKPREETPLTPAATPAPAPPPRSQAAVPPTPPAAPTPALPPRVDLEPPTPSPAKVVLAYVASIDPAARVEIIHDLADAEAGGLAALEQLFQLETDSALKSVILTLADTFDDEHLEGRLAVLRRALGKEQPEEVREDALGLLVTVSDRRAIPLWQTLLADEDPTTREIAEEQIELLRDLE